MDRKKTMFGFIQEFWNLVKCNLDLDNGDTDGWYKAIESAGKLNEKYGDKYGNADRRFCWEMINLWMVYMNNRVRESRGEKLSWYNERIGSEKNG